MNYKYRDTPLSATVRVAVQKKKLELPLEEFVEFLRDEMNRFSSLLHTLEEQGQPAQIYTKDGWQESSERKVLRYLSHQLAQLNEDHPGLVQSDPRDMQPSSTELEADDLQIYLLGLANRDEPSELAPRLAGFAPGEDDPNAFVSNVYARLVDESAIFRKVAESRNPSWEAGRLLRDWNAMGRIDLTALERERLEWKERREKRTLSMPEPRLIRNPRDAELVAVEWMRFWGFDDAKATPVGADEGIDVVSETAVAQVKAHMGPIGRPDIQNLAGVAAVEEKSALFFALNGYTAQAIQWADKAKMALFTFDLQGVPESVNKIARDYQVGE